MLGWTVACQRFRIEWLQKNDRHLFGLRTHSLHFICKWIRTWDGTTIDNRLIWNEYHSPTAGRTARRWMKQNVSKISLCSWLLGLDVCARMCIYIVYAYACICVYAYVTMTNVWRIRVHAQPIHSVVLTKISPFEIIDEDGHWNAKMCGDQCCVTLLIVDIILVRVVGMVSYSVCMRGLGSTCVGVSIAGSLYADVTCYI